MACDELFSLSLDLAAETIKCGGEVHRAEETVRRINKEDCFVFALPTLIAAQKNGRVEIRRIGKEEINLSRLAAINSVSRKLSFESSAVKKYRAFTSKKAEIICNFGAAASFSAFFGGRALEAVLAGVIGIIIGSAWYKSGELPLFSSNLTDSFISATLAFLMQLIGINIRPDKIIIGAIMLLVPGLTVVNAIRDMMYSDLAAGLLELFNAVMSALSIAFGVAGAYIIFGKIW